MQWVIYINIPSSFLYRTQNIQFLNFNWTYFYLLTLQEKCKKIKFSELKTVFSDVKIVEKFGFLFFQNVFEDKCIN